MFKNFNLVFPVAPPLNLTMCMLLKDELSKIPFIFFLMLFFLLLFQLAFPPFLTLCSL